MSEIWLQENRGKQTKYPDNIFFFCIIILFKLFLDSYITH